MSGVRRILAIDGGGIKGALPVSFLAQIEEITGERIVDHFDLIAGTSTGGIIAVGLALGLPAKQILAFYREHGPEIFGQEPTNVVARSLARLSRNTKRVFYGPKYNAEPLRKALLEAVGERRLGECLTRVIVPAYQCDRRSVYVFKTAHHPRFECDYREKAVDVIMSTAAAPTYFPAHQTPSGITLVDGGIWANNPAGMAAVEAIGVLKWDAAQTKLLSLGCGEEVAVANTENGIAGLGFDTVRLFMQGQSFASHGTAKILLGPANIKRIDPSVPKGFFRLDDTSKLDSLISIGCSCAREELPMLRDEFLAGKRETFVPYRSLVG